MQIPKSSELPNGEGDESDQSEVEEKPKKKSKVAGDEPAKKKSSKK